MSDSDFKLRDDKFFMTGGAQADNDGISIASSRVQGEIVTAQYDVYGLINVFRQNKSLSELNDEQSQVQERMDVRSIAKAIVITIFTVCILLCVMTKSILVIIGSLIFILNAFYTRFFVYTVTWVANAVSIRSRQMKLRYNGALHMVMNAFQRERKIPTMEDIKECTCYSERSSTNEVSKAALKAFLQCILITALMIALVAVAADSTKLYQNVTRYALIIAMAVAGTAFCKAVYDGIEIMVDKGFKNKWLMNLMQKPFMMEPTEKELELALEALKGYEKMEIEIDEHYAEYAPVSMQIDLVNGKIIFNLLNGRHAKYSYSEYLEFLINRSDAETSEEEPDEQSKDG